MWFLSSRDALRDHVFDLHESEVCSFSAKARQIRSLCMQHESEVKMSRGFSAKARQIRSLCMQHESEVKMSRGADMTTHPDRANSPLVNTKRVLASLILIDDFSFR